MQPVISLKLGEKDHFFHFNNYALIELGKITKSETLSAAEKLNELITQNFLLGITSIVYCGLVGYAYSKFNINHGYKIEEISEFVANADMNSWQPIWDAYKQATGMSKFAEDQIENATSEIKADMPIKKKHSGKS